MNRGGQLNTFIITNVMLGVVALSSAPVCAQTTHQEGVIKARDGMRITMGAADAEVVVLLTNTTDIGQNVGRVPQQANACLLAHTRTSYSGRKRIRLGKTAHCQER